MSSILALLLTLIILIVVHEFGHFSVARLLNIKVLRFSLGFGKTLWSWRDKKGTEYVIAAFPVGGYVKMLDEAEAPVAPAEQHQAFNRQPVWKRFAVVLAGPLFNFFLAVIAFWLMFVIGVVTVAPIVGEIIPKSIAAQAQFKAGDEIIELGGEPTASWRAVQVALISHIGEEQPLTATLKNIHSGERRQRQLATQQWQPGEKIANPIESIGIKPYMPAIPMIIGEVTPNEPAQLAGLKKGDKLIAIDNKPAKDWKSFVTYIRVRPQQPVKVTVERQGEQQTFAVKLTAKQDKQGKEIGFIGIKTMPAKWPQGLIRKQQFSLLGAVIPAVKETTRLTLLTFEMLGKMVVGKLSFQNVSGPIGIAQGAGQTVKLGPAYYLGFLALISIGLGILNILPIPVLDGGHLLFYVIEIVRRRPVSEKVQLYATQIGLIVLVGLMMLAIVNDLYRLL